MDSAEDIRMYLFSLVHRGIKYELDRIIEAAERCGNSYNAYKSFHVAGTNGKGSTCAYLDSVLRCKGYKTGLFTSPHLLRFEERIQINGKPVSEELWLEIFKEQREIIDKYKLTFFEATALMAFEIFKRSNVEWAVFETGLGGRLDATNIIRPEVSVITKIAMDHMELLGADIVSIAGEKLGIVKEKVPLVMAYNDDPSVNDLVNKVCVSKNVQYTLISMNDASNIHIDSSGTIFGYKNRCFSTPLIGRFQTLNSLLAIKALEQAGIDDYAELEQGIRQACLPGRFQEINISGKQVIFDVGHNPDAADALVDTLKRKYCGKSVCMVAGIMKDKDTKGILEKYAAIADRIILSRPEIPRAESADRLRELVPDHFKKNCIVVPKVADAVRRALTCSEQTVCITGSFYTVSEAFQAVGIDPYRYK